MRERTQVKSTNFLIIFLAVIAMTVSTFSSDQKAGQSGRWGKGFNTPEAAGSALLKAAEADDAQQMVAILGPQGKDLVSSADPVRDKTYVDAFVKLAKESMTLDTSTPNKAIMLAGPSQWPMPIPIVKRGGQWFFDTAAGRREILYRRIGSNELDAIEICHIYVRAQHEYAMEPHDGVNQYAQRILSSPGKQDGLFWQNVDGSPGGPLSETIAKAIAEGYTLDKPAGLHGYYFKILKGQGPAAPLGQLNYVIEGVMIGGFGLVAVPMDYRITGVKTFMVNNQGIVYEKDFGPNSLEIVKKMELYNPDKTWQPTNDAWPAVVATAPQ